MAGVAGGGDSSRAQYLTHAIAGAVACAMATCAGEYVATKSKMKPCKEKLIWNGPISLIIVKKTSRNSSELLQVIELFKEERVLRQQLLLYYDRNPECMLQAMMALEFGVLDEKVRLPVIADVTNLVLFTCVALPSVVPFWVLPMIPKHGLIAAVVTALLMVGVVKTWATRGSCVTASVENFGGGLEYGVGILFDNIVT